MARRSGLPGAGKTIDEQARAAVVEDLMDAHSAVIDHEDPAACSLCDPRTRRAQCLPGLDPASVAAQDGHATADNGDGEPIVRTLNGPDRCYQTGDSDTAGLGGVEGEDLVGAPVDDKQPSRPIEAQPRWRREPREPGLPVAVGVKR